MPAWGEPDKCVHMNTFYIQMNAWYNVSIFTSSCKYKEVLIVNPPICFPGTVVPVSSSDLLAGLFAATKGITLAQVCEIIGQEPGTVQNWIKRGYVSPPTGRKYTKGQTARIILINLLRDAMPIEKVAKLLSYVNGNLLDTSDDIMDDSDIYRCLCKTIIPELENGTVAIEDIFTGIEEQLIEFKEPYPGSKDRLRIALKIMACAFESARFKKSAVQLAENII